MIEAIRRLALWLLRFWEIQVEMQERHWLLLDPREEEFLHWSFEDESWQLHGRYLPPRGERRGVTRGGWCVGRVR